MTAKSTDAANRLFTQKDGARSELDELVAAERQKALEIQAAKTARLREQRLAKEAADIAAKASKKPRR